MDSDKVSGDDSDGEVIKCKMEPLDNKRANFAQELEKDEAERRYIKTKFECNKDDEDFKQKVDDMIEEIGKLDVSNTAQLDDGVDVCSKCAGDILESALVVGEDSYHSACFTCDHCSASLTGKFFQVGDQKYCEADQEVGLDRCSVCSDYLRSGAVLVAGSSYHSHCFACSSCGLPILDKFYTTDEGRWLCEEDYRLTKPKCHTCDLPIMGRMLTAMERQFHPACFTCSVCQAMLDGLPFMAEGEVVHCRECYSKFKAAQCHRCGEAIVSNVGKRMTLITCDEKNYHYQCYTCQVCGKNLSGKQVFLDGEDVACGDCKLQKTKQM
eukprot:GFUD01002673.1.p1 GENE.GFUD01002673.1~~GFUD01002673.1.p1  ORF type:complete len:325 (-),score=77.97 GFUD01002673.1:11-985(-)